MEKLKEFLQNYYAKNNVLPPKSILCHELGLDLNQINSQLRALVQEGFLREFAGKLRMGAPRPATGPTPTTPKINVKMPLIVKGVLFAISLVAMIISIGYSFVWVSQFLDPIRAVLLSASIVVYVTFAPEGAGLMLARKTATGAFLASLLVITALAALVFSMAMTVIGQYNTMTDLLVKESQADISASRGTATLEILKAEEKTAQAAVDGLQREVNLQQDALTRLDPGTKEFDTATRKLTDLQNRLYYARVPLTKTREKLLSYVQTDEAAAAGAVARENFYVFAARQTGVGQGVIEFILYLIPALFMDIIAPLGMFVALGLGRKKLS